MGGYAPMVYHADLADPAMQRSFSPVIYCVAHRICADPRFLGTTSDIELANPFIPLYLVAALVPERPVNVSGKARTSEGALVLGDLKTCSAVILSPKTSLIRSFSGVIDVPFSSRPPNTPLLRE